MKIIEIIPGKVWGGAEQYILDLGRALTERGHEVEYLCRPAEAVTRRLDAEHIPYRLLDSSLRVDVEGADAVHIHDSKFVKPAVKSVSACKNAPRVVLTRHIARGSRVMPWNRRYWRSLHRVVFVSDIARNLWRERNLWMPLQKCTVIHNSIPRTAASTDTPDLRKKFSIGTDTPLLMLTGRIRRSKGCETLIKALGLVKDLPWAMVFVGATKPADYRERLMKLATAEGIADRIFFTGFTSNARSLVSQADIGVQPSIVREAFGLSILEFMQAGKPVITTDNGGQREFVNNGSDGFLIAPDNVEALTEALRKLLRDRQLREKMGKHGQMCYTDILGYDTFVNNITEVFR